MAKAKKAPAFSGRAVLRQATHGRLPPFWQMYRWRRRGDLARLAAGATALALLLLLAVAALLIENSLDPDALSANGSPLASAWTTGAAPLVVAAIVAAIAALMSLAVVLRECVALLLPRSLRPVLVLLPEGCVERTGVVVRRVRVVAYADISHIELRVSKLRMAANRHLSRLPLIATRSSIQLLLHDWTGRRHTWTLRGGFGSPAALAQAILAAYGQYTNTISARRPRVNAPPR